MKKKLTINLISVVIGIGIFFITNKWGWSLDGFYGIGLVLLLFLFFIFCVWGIAIQ